MSKRVVILGAGFGGLELSTVLSEELGDEAGVTLIDKGDSFAFGYTKLDVMFGRAAPEQVRMPYRDIARPGVTVLQEEVTAIDPASRTVTTDAGTHEADVLVVALGADLDVAATPGLAEGGYEFYTRAGAERVAPVLRDFSAGHVVIGVASFPIKCPPAPSEAALLLDELLRERGVRDACRITYAIPMPRPVPPSPQASSALIDRFADRGIELIAENGVAALDPGRRVAVLADGTELAYDLFLGVPEHRAPAPVIACGLAANGYVPADVATLETGFPGVYAIGDVAELGIPKAGAFAESAGRAVARRIVAEVRGEEPPPYRPTGSCYVEFGGGQVGRVDIEVVDGEKRGTFNAPSAALAADKERFGSERRARWFGG